MDRAQKARYTHNGLIYINNYYYITKSPPPQLIRLVAKGSPRSWVDSAMCGQVNFAPKIAADGERAGVRGLRAYATQR